jgi:uncharacterized protein GlcG (DUF336 family)
MRPFVVTTLGLVVTSVMVLVAQPGTHLGAAGTAAAPETTAVGASLAPLATQDLSLDQAEAVLAAILAAAAEQGTKMDIAVVDGGGNLKAFARMDGAWLGSIDIAMTKARTARYFDLPTEELGQLSQPGGPLYGIEVSNGGLITFPGGLPLRAADGTVIGAIGVSGSTVEDDRAVAEAGATVLAQNGLDLPATFDQPSGGGGLAGGIEGTGAIGEEIPT